MKKCPLCNHDMPQDLVGETIQSPVQRFVSTYCDLFKEKYGTNPTILGVDAGVAKRLVKDLGYPKACSLVRVYLQMEDSFFVTRRHDLKTFASNIQKVTIAHDTGSNISQREAQQSERRAANRNIFARLLGEDER